MMATMTTNAPFMFTGLRRVPLVGMIQGWYEVRATRKALSKLTVQQLDDIGLVPSDIAALKG